VRVDVRHRGGIIVNTFLTTERGCSGTHSSYSHGTYASTCTGTICDTEYALRLIERGVPLAQVHDLLGHASITTTAPYDNQKLEKPSSSHRTTRERNMVRRSAALDRVTAIPSSFVKNSTDLSDSVPEPAYC
jgi:hypothetical protein